MNVPSLLAVFVLLWAAWCARAEAQTRDTVLLLESGALRPGLCAALRIQLSDIAEVSCRTEGAVDGSLATRIEHASRQVAREHLQLAVLLERDPDPARVRMILVGAQDDRAALAIESIEDRPAPDVDRSLALKVRDTLELMERAPFAPAATLRGARERPLRLLAEGGAALAISDRARPAGSFALGARRMHEAWYGELVLTGQVTAAQRVRTSVGTVVEKQWGMGLSLRAGRMLGRFGAGLALEAALVHTSALGVTDDGASAERGLNLARLGAGIDLRFALLDGPARVWLRFAPALQVDPLAQRFALDHREALSLGRLHAWLPLTLLFDLPFPHRSAGHV